MDIDDGIGAYISYKISRIPTSPFYAFQPITRAFPTHVDGVFRAMALDLYVVLALIGRQIFETLP